MPEMGPPSNSSPKPELDFTGLNPKQILQLKIRNNIPLDVEENKLLEQALKDERNDDQPRRGKY